MTELQFDLGGLGWKAFQDLCRTVLAHELGQTVQVFSTGRDKGRDAAFVGTWEQHGSETLTGTFAVQCKFKGGGGTFSVAALRGEQAKISRLHRKGLADNYVLMTNATVSAEAEERITETVVALGPQHVLVIGGEMINRYLVESRQLRALVPRVYGLGDLGEILDDRAYAQSRSVLSTMSESLARFVVTEPYTRSIEALNKHGFVLLLGEPMAGKSMIAAALAVAAVDQWDCGVLKADAPRVFVDHWNPHRPGQFFWIDDAFGTTQYIYQRADDWNRILLQIQSAVSKGTRVVMTSRDYIWKSARQDLKLHQFAPLEDSQVVIDVRELALDDRRQILYNHLKYGDQPRAFLSAVKPHLDAACQVRPFLPEVARRFGDPRFTENIRPTRDSVVRFFQRPVEYLREVLDNLAADDHAALGLIYMARGRLASPVRLSEAEEVGIRLLGGEPRRMRTALRSMDGSLAQLVEEIKATGHPSAYWAFRHPTIADALAQQIGNDPDLLHIFVMGMPLASLLSETTAGDVGLRGALIITDELWPLVMGRLVREGAPEADRIAFLTARTSDEFLQLLVASESTWVERALSRPPAGVRLAARLARVGLLSEGARTAFVSRLTDLAAEGSPSYIAGRNAADLFRNQELQAAQERVRSELLPRLDDIVWNLESDWDEDEAEDPDGYLQDMSDELDALQDTFSDDAAALELINDAREQLDDVRSSLEERIPPEPDWDDMPYDRPSHEPVETSAEIFDDLDE